MGDWRRNLIRDDEGLARVLREAKTIAILGAKTERSEPAFFVPAYLDARGYRVLPVNPALAGRSLWGTTIVATLADLPEPADVIEVFRRPGFLPAHVDEILVLPWRPQTVWLQLGIRHAPSVERLARAGIRVVENRCMMPEHRRLL